MQRYVVLAKFTDAIDQQTIAEGTPQITAVCESHGGSVIDAYLTMGALDIVLVLDFPGNGECAAAMLEYAQKGLLTTQTMPAFSAADWADLAG